MKKKKKKFDHEEKLKVEDHGRPGNFLPIFPKRTNTLVTQNIKIIFLEALDSFHHSEELISKPGTGGNEGRGDLQLESEAALPLDCSPAPDQAGKRLRGKAVLFTASYS